MKQAFRRGLALVSALVSALVLGVGMAALPAAPAATLETDAAAADVVKIACVGASTTGGAFTNTSWPAEMQQIVGGLCEVKNFGVNSRTVIKGGIETYLPGQDMDYTLTGEYKSSLAFKADYVLIMLGGNDAKPYNWKDGDNTFVEDYKALVNSYLEQEQKPEVIVVIEPWIVSDNTDIKETTMANSVRPAYTRIAQEMGLRTIDLYTPTRGKPELYGDDVHPNEAGYKLLGEEVAKALSEMGVIPEGSENVPVPFRPNSSVGDFYGEFDGYEVMQWEKGTTGYFQYNNGMLAEKMGIDAGTVVKNLTINVSYYWDAAGSSGGNDWWHFNTTDKDGQSAPSVDGGNPHDSGFGTFAGYGMVRREWNTLTVSRNEQMLGGSGVDWSVNVGALEAANSLYIRGFEVVATLADDTVKTFRWGTMKGRRGADDGATLKIACVGASTTEGTNGHSYPAYLQMMLGNNCEVKNFGYPGASVTKGRQWSYIDGWHTENYQRMYADSLAYKADVVIIDIGGNDAQVDVWNRGTFAADYEELINAYRNQGNEPLIMITAGTYAVPLNDSLVSLDRYLVEKVIPAMVAIADKYDIPVFDLRGMLATDPDAYIDTDGVHYTAAGYKKEAEEICAMLLPLIEIPDNGEADTGAMLDPVDMSIAIGEYDGYRSLMWEKGQTGYFAYKSGALAFALGIDGGTVVDNLTIDVSYYWDAAGSAGGNDWWHFDTTDKDGLSAPSADGGNPHDNGFGQFAQYGMVRGKWSEFSVSRQGQLLGGSGSDWRVSVGSLEANNSLYIRGFKVTATLADDTVKEACWGVYATVGDKAALNAALEDEVTDLSTYTEETAAAYTAALEAAQAISADKFATQEQIDAAAAALAEAKAALEVKPEPEPEPETTLGDVNGDKEVNTTDARLVLQYAVGKIEAAELDLSVADVNRDGEINTTDARLILQKAVGKIEDFD